MPLRFTPLDEKRKRCDLKDFPYHIVFEIERARILITVVRHHKRHQAIQGGIPLFFDGADGSGPNSTRWMVRTLSCSMLTIQ
jgi:hypothetical protein